MAGRVTAERTGQAFLSVAPRRPPPRGDTPASERVANRGALTQARPPGSAGFQPAAEPELPPPSARAGPRTRRRMTVGKNEPIKERSQWRTNADRIVFLNLKIEYVLFKIR